MDVECPICGEYSGPPASVEAHISRSTEGDHEGEVGRAFRPQLQEQVDPMGVASSVETTELATGEGSGIPVQRQERIDSATAVTPVETTEPVTTEGGGVPVPVSTTAIFAIVAVVAVGAFLWGSSTQPQGGSEAVDQGPQQTVVGGV